MAVLAVAASVVAALLTAVLFVFVVFSVYLVTAHRRYAHIPQPKGASFFFGHLPVLRREGKKKFSFDLWNEWYLECGPVFVLWFISMPVVVAMDPDSIKALSGKDVSKPAFNPFEKVFGQRFIKNCLITIRHYEDWKDRRHAFDQAFTRSYLRGLVPIYNNVTKMDLIEPLREKADGTTKVPMKSEFTRVTLQVISQVAFGADFERDPFVQSQAGKEGLTSLLKTAFEGMREATNNPLLQLVPFYGQKYVNVVRSIRAIGRHCIELRIKALRNKEKLPLDIMSQILSIVHTDENIDIEDLVDEFLLFYLAGQENTSTLLSFAVGLLIQHQDVLQRVMEEIDEVVGDKTSVEADDLDKLTYMNQVLEETLRLYPPTIVQKASPPGGISLCGYHIPAGTSVMTEPYSILRSSEYFDDPLKFDPGRFDPGQNRPSPYVYYPFGFGHRSCIGRVFAMIEAKVVLVHLLRAYELTLPDSYCLKLAATPIMQPEEGLPCFLTSR